MKQLDEHVTQFRVAQKRLLIMFKDKTPTSLKNLDILLDSSFKQASSYDRKMIGKERVGFKLLHCLLPAGLRIAQPCQYCFYSLAQKWVFRPAGATRCPDKHESWHGPVPTFTFIGAKMWEYSPTKLSKFQILARNLYLRGDSFAIFLRNSQRLYASISSF